MLFDHEDRRIIVNALMRKAAESATLVSDQRISIARRNILATSIGKNMLRLQSMYRIAMNDFSSIEQDLEHLSSDEYLIPPSCLEDYESILTSDARDEEGYLMVMEYLVRDFLPILTDAYDLSGMMSKGFHPVLDSERVDLIGMRDSMIRFKEYALENSQFDVYKNVIRYIDHVIFECNLVLRIGAYKEVSTDECAFDVDEYYTCDPGPFEDLFLEKMTPDELSLYERHRRSDDSRITLVIARCIMNDTIFT